MFRFPSVRKSSDLGFAEGGKIEAVDPKLADLGSKDPPRPLARSFSPSGSAGAGGANPAVALTPAAIASASEPFETPEPVRPQAAGFTVKHEIGEPIASSPPWPVVLIDGAPAKLLEELPPATEKWAPGWSVKRARFAGLVVSGDVSPSKATKVGSTMIAAGSEILLELWVHGSLALIPGAVYNARHDGKSIEVSISGILEPAVTLWPGAAVGLLLGAPAALVPGMAIPCVAHDVYPGGLRGPDQAYCASPGSPRNCFNPKFVAALAPERAQSDPAGYAADLQSFVRYVAFQFRRRYQRAASFTAAVDLPDVVGSFCLAAYHEDQTTKSISVLSAWSIGNQYGVPPSDAVEAALARVGLPSGKSTATPVKSPGAKYWPKEQLAVIDPKTFAPGVRSVDAYKSTHLEVGELLGGWLRTGHPQAYDQARRVVLSHAFFEWDIGIFAGGGFDFGDSTRRKARHLESLGRMMGAARVAHDDDTFAICEWLAELACKRILDLWNDNPAQPDPVSSEANAEVHDTPWVTMSGSTGSLDDRHLLVPNDCAYFVGLAAFASALVANKATPGSNCHKLALELRDRVLKHLEEDWWVPGSGAIAHVFFLDLPADGDRSGANVYDAKSIGDGTFTWLYQGFELANQQGSPFYLAVCELIEKKTKKPIEHVGLWAF